jgi:hypothetical protein
MFAALPLAVLVAGLTATPASAAPTQHAKGSRTARLAKPRACAKPPVEVVSGKESATFALATCGGSASPDGVDRLSILARPAGVSRPTEPAKGHGAEVAPGIRRIDPRLVERMQRLAEHFRKDGSVPRIVLVQEGAKREPASGHAGMVRGLDFRIDGVTGVALDAYCKTLADTSCGFYAKDGHLRMEARAPGSGHFAWVGSASPQPDPAVTETAEAPPSKLSPLPAASMAVPLVKPSDTTRFF